MRMVDNGSFLVIVWVLDFMFVVVSVVLKWLEVELGV